MTDVLDKHPLPAALKRTPAPTLQMPYADLLPPLSTAEREALLASIRAEGVRDPIVVDEAGVILDGHHRYELAAVAGVSFATVERAGLTEGEKRAFVLAANFQRRNLSPEQKSELRKTQTEIAGTLKDEDKTQADIALALGVDQGTVSRWLDVPNMQSHKGHADNRVKLEPEDKALILERVDAGEKQEQVAADFGVSRAHVSKAAKQQRQKNEREESLREIGNNNTPLPDQRYPVLYADPPWQYENPPIGATNRAIENHYPTMTLEEICAMPVETCAADGCVLFLWATAPKLAECMRVIDAWGFTYRTCAVWVKDKIGMGYHVRNQHELLLIAKRGELAVPDVADRPSSVLNAPRGEHSAKPEAYYAMIERMYPNYPRLELFLRGEARKGWHGWGNQAA